MDDVAFVEKGFVMDDEVRLSNIFEMLPEDHIRQITELALLPDEERQAALNNLAEYFQQQNPYDPGALPEPGSGYEKIKPYARMSKDEVRHFVGRVWGQWLAAFNPNLEIDAMSRKQLEDCDKVLMHKLEKTFTTEELAQIIQTEKIRNETEIKKYLTPNKRKGVMKASDYMRHYGITAEVP